MTTWGAYRTHPQVRPFILAGGRTRARTRHPLLIHTIVSAPQHPQLTPSRLTAQERGVYQLVRRRMSVAEVSAHSGLALGLVRVILGDLASRDLITIHPATESITGPGVTVTLPVLEKVLLGLQRL